MNRIMGSEGIADEWINGRIKSRKNSLCASLFVLQTNALKHFSMSDFLQKLSEALSLIRFWLILFWNSPWILRIRDFLPFEDGLPPAPPKLVRQIGTHKDWVELRRVPDQNFEQHKKPKSVTQPNRKQMSEDCFHCGQTFVILDHFAETTDSVQCNHKFELNDLPCQAGPFCSFDCLQEHRRHQKCQNHLPTLEEWNAIHSEQHTENAAAHAVAATRQREITSYFIPLQQPLSRGHLI